MKIKFSIKENKYSYFAEWEEFFNSTIINLEYDKKSVIRKILGKGFVPLGEGSFRVVFAFPNRDPYVLKIAKFEDANSMNEKEVNPHIQTKYASILPKMYMSADDYSWIVTERVYSVDYNFVIKQVPGIVQYNQFISFLQRIKRNAKTMKIREAIQNAMHDYSVKSISPAINKIIDFSIEYNIAVWDLWERNLGKTEDGRLVILDASFEEDFDNAKFHDDQWMDSDQL